VVTGPRNDSGNGWQILCECKKLEHLDCFGTRMHGAFAAVSAMAALANSKRVFFVFPTMQSLATRTPAKAAARRRPSSLSCAFCASALAPARSK
jgi:hypothetical protein